MQDLDFMHQALELAQRGRGWTSPNPMVGAVIVKDGRVIGRGYHRRRGQAHAERNALADCSESPEGATLYVTLEPCCHQGRQPPCTDAILEAGIRRVVVGSGDPNPLVAGKGIAQLRARGVEVTEHVLEEACTRLNRIFFHYIQTRRPYGALKYAMTLDGKAATRTGASRWITGPEARERAHRDRHRFAAIMVGIGTALADDPALTCRLEGGPWRQPLRIVVDSQGRLPLDALLVRTAQEIPTLVAVGPQASAERTGALREAGCSVWASPPAEGGNGAVNLPALLDHAGSLGIDSILVEGGPALHGALIDGGLANRVQAYIAPKLFGGASAPGPVAGRGVALPADALCLSSPTVTALGPDLLLECAVSPSVESEATPCSPAL